MSDAKFDQEKIAEIVNERLEESVLLFGSVFLGLILHLLKTVEHKDVPPTQGGKQYE